MVTCVNILVNDKKHTVTSQAHICFLNSSSSRRTRSCCASHLKSRPELLASLQRLCFYFNKHPNMPRCSQADGASPQSCRALNIFFIWRRLSLLQLPLQAMAIANATTRKGCDFSWCFVPLCVFYPERSGGSQEHSWLPGLKCNRHGVQGRVGGFHPDGLLQGQVGLVVFKIQISFF